MKVFKYPLDFGACEIDIQEGAQLLCVRYQDSEHGKGVMLYARVKPNAPRQNAIFYVLATGVIVPDGTTYLGSIETPDKEIFHVFVAV